MYQLIHKYGQLIDVVSIRKSLLKGLDTECIIPSLNFTSDIDGTISK